MTIWLKQDVQGFLHPIVAKAVGTVAIVFNSYDEDLFITSYCEGQHGIRTLHPFGYAFDLRAPRDVPTSVLKGRLKTALGNDFDIIFERDHIHIEYDPEV